MVGVAGRPKGKGVRRRRPGFPLNSKKDASDKWKEYNGRLEKRNLQRHVTISLIWRLLPLDSLDEGIFMSGL